MRGCPCTCKISRVLFVRLCEGSEDSVKKWVVFYSSIVLFFVIMIVAMMLYNYYNDPLYYATKIFNSYLDISKDFNYTMAHDLSIQKKHQDYYFELEYSNHDVITVSFWEFPNTLTVSRSFLIDFTELESDYAGMIDIISATCMVLDPSFIVEKSNAVAEKMMKQLEQFEMPFTEPIKMRDYFIFFASDGENIDFKASYKEE